MRRRQKQREPRKSARTAGPDRRHRNKATTRVSVARLRLSRERKYFWVRRTEKRIPTKRSPERAAKRSAKGGLPAASSPPPVFSSELSCSNAARRCQASQHIATQFTAMHGLA